LHGIAVFFQTMPTVGGILFSWSCAATLLYCLLLLQLVRGLVVHDVNHKPQFLTVNGLREILKQELQRANDDDATKTTVIGDSDAKESILKSRLEQLLASQPRTRIGPSTIPNAGRGLFATVDCQQGDLLTCYPGDVLVRCSTNDADDDDNDNDEWEENENSSDNNNNNNNDTFEWGPHVPKEMRIINDQILQPSMMGYVLQVTNEYAILGLANLDKDLAYAGHFANDGARPPRRESQIATYVLESNEVANAMHISLEDCHMITVATRDISKGEEILVTYGPDYWMEHASELLWNEHDYDNPPNDERMEDRPRSNGKGFG